MSNYIFLHAFMDSGITQVVIAIISVFGGAGAWQFYQHRLKISHSERESDRGDQNMFRDDLRERVAALEKKLDETQEEKEKLHDELTEVLQTLAEYKVRIEFLEKENERLKNK